MIRIKVPTRNSVCTVGAVGSIGSVGAIGSFAIQGVEQSVTVDIFHEVIDPVHVDIPARVAIGTGRTGCTCGAGCALAIKRSTVTIKVLVLGRITNQIRNGVPAGIPVFAMAGIADIINFVSIECPIFVFVETGFDFGSSVLTINARRFFGSVYHGFRTVFAIFSLFTIFAILTVYAITDILGLGDLIFIEFSIIVGIQTDIDPFSAVDTVLARGFIARNDQTFLSVFSGFALITLFAFGVLCHRHHTPDHKHGENYRHANGVEKSLLHDILLATSVA